MKPTMRIVEGKVIVCSPGRNFVTLKIVTEEGLSLMAVCWHAA